MNSRVLAIPLLIKWEGIFFCAEIINEQLKLLLGVCLWVFAEKKKKVQANNCRSWSQELHIFLGIISIFVGAMAFLFYSVKMISLVVLRTTKVAKLLPFPMGRQEIFVPINTNLYILIIHPPDFKESPSSLGSLFHVIHGIIGSVS